MRRDALPAGVTFYTKNMTVELDKERRARKKVESTAEAMRHALKVVYRNLRSVRIGKGKKGMATPHKVRSRRPAIRGLDCDGSEHDAVNTRRVGGTTFTHSERRSIGTAGGIALLILPLTAGTTILVVSSLLLNRCTMWHCPHSPSL
jgi:hypothetical protein